MRIIKRYIIDYSVTNGLGKPAISIYLSGCDKLVKCKGCHNWEMQEESENDYDIEQLKEELDTEISNFKVFHKSLRIAILGGEPLAKYNRDITLELLKYIKEKYEDAITILYSWRDVGQIGESKNYLDFGVLGGYEESLHQDNTLPASSNQRVWNFNTNSEEQAILLKS